MHRSIFLIIAVLQAFQTLSRSEIPAEPNDPASLEFTPNPILWLNPQPSPGSIQLDGLIEPSWQSCGLITNFCEYEPMENRKPLVQTTGYVTYDDQALYVAFVCNDPDISNLRATYTDRDKIYLDDWVCVSIDPQCDHQKAYQFYVNPRGVQGDKLWQMNGNEDERFDAMFQSESHIYENRWTAEMRIPFESLRFPDKEKQDWLVHFTRHYPRRDRYIFSWMPISKNNNSLMEQAGHLVFSFIRKNQDERKIEFLPYMIATQNSHRDEDIQSQTFNNWHYDKMDRRMGFGFKYGLASNMITDFCYNPDFSQIEADAGQISINNPFALFYEEKRPFFQEGSDIYAVDQLTRGIILDQYVDLFYTRSINDPLVAGKLSGNVGKLTLGYTTALDRNTIFIIPFGESSTFLPTDKKSWNNILRAKWDMGNNSSVGFFTSDRRLGEEGSNTVAALDARVRLSEKWLFSAIAASTHTKELNDKTFSDAIPDVDFQIHSRTFTADFDGESFNGTLLRGKIQYNTQHQFGAVAYQDFSPGFRADNGFIFANNHRNVETLAGYTFRFTNNPIFSSIEPRVNSWRKFGYDGFIKDTGIRPAVFFNFRKQVVLQIAGFLFNREHLHGKQFGDARSMWMTLTHNAYKNISGFGFIRFGKEINRFGTEGDVDNPFEIVPTLTYAAGVTVLPTAKINYDLQYQSYNLWKAHMNQGKNRTQDLVRNVITFQFNKQFCVRLIGEYNYITVYNGAAQKMDRYKYLTFDPLFSYKMNAFSVFYLGMHFGAKNNERIFWNDMRSNEQTVYAKFQYLLQR
jgi:hypothetical protein